MMEYRESMISSIYGTRISFAFSKNTAVFRIWFSWSGNNLRLLKEMKGQYGWSLVNNIGWGHMVKSLIGPSKELNCGVSVAGGPWRILGKTTVLSNWFLWGTSLVASGWESTCQCRGHGFYPWSGKMPQALEPLSPCATTKALPPLFLH